MTAPRRNLFDTTRYQPALLASVESRPIENAGLTLIRLEFEVFAILIDGSLRSTGQAASRDIVLCPAMQGDAGVFRFAKALEVDRPDRLESWRRAKGRWIEIRFGDYQKPDERQPFLDIRPYSPMTDAPDVREAAKRRRDAFQSPSEAARQLGVSVQTIRRYVDKHAKEFGDKLVRRGGTRNDRLINVVVLRHLLPPKKCR